MEKITETKRGRKVQWTMDARAYLLFLLKEKGLTFQETADELRVSRPTVIAEVRNGVNRNNFDKINRGAANTYNPLRSIVNTAIKGIGIDGVKALLNAPGEVESLLQEFVNDSGAEDE